MEGFKMQFSSFEKHTKITVEECLRLMKDIKEGKDIDTKLTKSQKRFLKCAVNKF